MRRSMLYITDWGNAIYHWRNACQEQNERKKWGEGAAGGNWTEN